VNASATAHPDLLAAIVAATRHIVDVRSADVPLAEMERRATVRPARVGVFREALARRDRINVIAECKRRSPSRGVLRHDYDPPAIAAAYEQAGAAAISVITEPTFFDGSLEHLAVVRQEVRVPLLRKDFVVDRYQIAEARAVGADAVLLIVSALSVDDLKELRAYARQLELDVLVEVHGLDEIEIAAEAGATIIGVNNRNLRTLSVDTDVSLRAVERIPDGCIAVAESGLTSGEDLRRLRSAGYNAFLIGERFMTADNPGAALRLLLDSCL
jgi:indole-3-glycerol phosphate synthase